MKNTNTKSKKVSMIVRIVLIALAVIFLLVGIFAKKIFGEDSTVGGMMSENVGDVANVFKWIGSRGPAILRSITITVVVLLVSWLLRLLLGFLFKLTEKGKTAVKLVTSFIKYLSVIVIFFLVLQAFGVDTMTLLAGAGIFALMISLGSQSLVADIIAGLFITIEGQFRIGDIVVIDGFRGTVTEVGMRTTKMIDCGGNVQIVNNSSISNVVNMSDELSVAFCRIGVEYGDSIERIEKIIKDNIGTIARNVPSIKEGPYYKGLAEFGDSSMTIMLLAMCREDDRYQCERDINREVKLIFDRNDINVPFPQIVLNEPTTFDDNISKSTRAQAKKFIEEQRELSKDHDVDNRT